MDLTSTDRPPNRLIAESSSYLRQHAENPVDWYPWGPEALARAKAEHKPILLSIGYSACHWCHVMARESFDDADIAAVMNRHFINIKVDREERPDLDHLYQTSAQVFTGRSAGWPLTMFLTPEQEPFYAGTYFPPVPRQSLPAFVDVLNGVIEAFRNHPEDVRRNVERVNAGLARLVPGSASEEWASERMLEQAGIELGRWFDPVHGGFGDGPKFPSVPPLSLMLRRSSTTGEPSLRDNVLRQLRVMAAGGIYDHLAGGFHRYTVDRAWEIPHFEKMLSDNAQLVRLYLDGWRLTKEERFRDVVEETLEYVRREMTHPDGAFFAAQDADSEGREGAFFLWTPDEIEAVLGRQLGGDFCRAYGVAPDGPFEGRNVLRRVANDQPVQADEATMKAARVRLLAARDKRVKPPRDEHILTSWNAMMISAFFDAANTFGVAAYRAAAEKALTFLLDYALAHDRVCRTVVGHRGRLNGYLDDAAWLATALLDAFETTSHRWYLDQARAVTESLISHFWDDDGDACFFTSHDHERLIQRLKIGTDGSVPSGNAVAASVLLRLFSFTGEERYYERAGRILKVFQRVMTQNPYGSAALLCVLDGWLAGPTQVVIVGRRDDSMTEAMRAAAYQRYVPNRMVFSGEVSAMARLPVIEANADLDDRPTAYVCRRQTCSTPARDVQQFEALL